MHFKVCAQAGAQQAHTHSHTHTLNIKWPMPTTLTSIIYLARTVGQWDILGGTMGAMHICGRMSLQLAITVNVKFAQA